MMQAEFFLEQEMKKIAKELNIKDKYINIILNELKALWVVNSNKKGSAILIGEKTKKENGKKKIVQIKEVRSYKEEAIEKMKLLTEVFKVYKALKEAEELSKGLFIKLQQENEEPLTRKRRRLNNFKSLKT